ncbi:MAG: carbohydrate ABC transporter permease [Firmicutes bacterium]|nr:carbohydrate ABC transporter permease [Bacillota bacterium]
MLVFSISFSSEESIAEIGYALIPKSWSLVAYRYILMSYEKVVNAYLVTIFTTVVGTIISVSVIALYSYAISRNSFKYKKFFTFYIFFTMMFSGGLVAWYMICTSVLHINNTIWGLILPSVMSPWYVIVLRSFFVSSVPNAIIESGKLDGAGEFRIFVQLVLPISLPGLATIALFTTLGFWNDWWLPMILNTNPKLYNLQFLLQSMMKNIELMNQSEAYRANAGKELANIPTDSMRMALCVIALGPILIVYPFFQKYFIQGLTIGAIKG